MSFEHKSPRGNTLLWIYPAETTPVITLESQAKWYAVYVILPGGIVESIPVSVIEEVSKKETRCLQIDHLFHPRLLQLLAQHYKGCVDPIAYEVAAGRWVLNEHPVDINFFYMDDE